MTITDQLISFAQTEPPQDAIDMLRLSMLDWAACGIAGAGEAEFQEFSVTTRAQCPGPATVFGGGSVPAATAALLNGTLSHALDYDDTHFAHIGHPSVAVLPAVLAVAQEVAAPLEDVVRAGTIGIEASILAGLWLGRPHYQVGYHQTATAGAFGATLGTACLLGLDKNEIRHALGLCASMASGLKAQFGTMGKPINAGLAARAGVEATLWAQSGVSGAQDGLAGPLGFGATHHAQMQDVAPGKGAWHITTISHKFHACCHGLHATLEALLEANLDVNDLGGVHIRTHPRWMSVCNIDAPATGLEAKFSYKQTAAMALLGHETGAIGSYTDTACKDADITRLRSLIRVSEDDRLSETQAEISVTFANGALRRLRHDLSQAISVERRTQKLRAKAAALVGDTRAKALWAAVEGDCLSSLTDQFGPS